MVLVWFGLYSFKALPFKSAFKNYILIYSKHINLSDLGINQPQITHHLPSPGPDDLVEGGEEGPDVALLALLPVVDQHLHQLGTQYQQRSEKLKI